jgi:hypothetical protein
VCGGALKDDEMREQGSRRVRRINKQCGTYPHKAKVLDV